MRGWFRRKPTAEATKPDLSDVPYAHAWGLTLDQWRALDERDRADRRLNVCHAPNFEASK